MGLFSRLSKWMGLNSHSTLGYLNTVQFFGALNDNMFRFLLAFMLIGIEGLENASDILSFATALFVTPFLLFSSAAGVLADKFSKQKVIVLMKAVEVAVLFAALFVFTAKSAFWGYSLLFILSIHSAIFGPSKYGIIPELVPKERVAKANGIITACTYLAAILGTFLASFVTEITGRNFPFTISFCFLFAIVGFLASLKIKATPSQGSKTRINPLFVLEIYRNLVVAKKKDNLIYSIFGSALFISIAAFTQLNVIPLAIHSLHLSDATGGYLFLATAFGIAFGAFLVGRLSKKGGDLRFSCFAGFMLALLFFLLSLFHTNLTLVSLCLFLLGLFGGFFVVPCDAYTQLNSPEDKRGQFIGAANFLGFLGILLASLLLYLFSTLLSMTPAENFRALSLLVLAIALLYTFRLFKPEK
jgi:acyl-[acyl-carrier-protein]-phospholipid O-acyltransferase/long-chain-fatty-acid--[acyl-carrier-protein] ligase